MPLAAATLAQVTINARDLKRAVAFYRDVLGVPHMFDAPPAMSFFNCGGVRLLVGVAEKSEFDHASSILYFKVADIDAAYRDLAARGVKFRDRPHFVAPLGSHELWMTFFDDSEGNVMALTSEKRKS
jgi:predicted enzyme related to lactoylglutathione lyase